MLIDIAHNVVLYTEPKKKVSHYLCLFNLQFSFLLQGLSDLKSSFLSYFFVKKIPLSRHVGLNFSRLLSLIKSREGDV